MKKVFILLLFTASIVTAQNKDFNYTLNGIDKVVISSDTSIKVMVGDSKDLVMTESNKTNSVLINNNHWRTTDSKKNTNKRKGLKAVYPGGTDDTNGFGFAIKKEGNTLFVSDLKSYMQRKGLQIKLPKNMNISIDAGNLGSVKIEGFTGEVEVATNVGKIEMKNVTGPITANTSVGKIDIDFSKVNQSSPITISSSVSEIDVAIPSDTKADLELKTQGTVYTNFDFKMPTKKGLPNVSGRKSIVSKINNGGVKIYIKSSMGNIYLRKK